MEANNNEVRFVYGVFLKSLEEQANDQGYTLGDNNELLERIRKAINICRFHVATENQVDSMFRKLNKKVADSLEPFDEPEETDRGNGGFGSTGEK